MITQYVAVSLAEDVIQFVVKVTSAAFGLLVRLKTLPASHKWQRMLFNLLFK